MAIWEKNTNSTARFLGHRPQKRTYPHKFAYITISVDVIRCLEYNSWNYTPKNWLENCRDDVILQKNHDKILLQ